MQWTDKIRHTKTLLIVAAILIAVASLVASHFLVQDLQREERNRMELWAQAMHVLSEADENTDLTFVMNVIAANNTIPIVVTNPDSTVSVFRNLDISGKDTAAYVESYARRMIARGDTIRVDFGDDGYHQLVCYDESILLRRLRFYPYWQLGLVVVFVAVAIFALLSFMRAEQNKVWVGLSKETAHQLGTPISSLMAWVEMLRETYPEDTLVPEMEKDVRRLERVADRFSKIGSMPEPTQESVNELLLRVIDYMARRTSEKVTITPHFPVENVQVEMSASLFEWVVENLCKNAVDAMEGEGRLDLWLFEEGDRVAIEVADTGRGIARADFDSVFLPGYTTKKRGWGLGLSLARRIVEDYHHGRIFVKSSELGVGTTFRIELNKLLTRNK